LVKLDEGLMITARLTDPGNPPVEISMPVEMVIHWVRQDGGNHGMIVYGY
jgi:uncharacterized OB-fold protein